VAAHCRTRGRMGRRCPPTASSLTRPAAAHCRSLCFPGCCCGRTSPASRMLDCPCLTMSPAQGCPTFPTASPSAVLAPLCLLLRWVAAMRLWSGVLLGRDCSDSYQLAGLVVVCPGLEAPVSKSCPCLLVPALGALLPLAHLVRAAAREAPVAAVAAAGCPRGHSSRLHARPWAVPVLVAVQTTMRTARGLLAEAPLGRAAAIAGMVCLSLCSMRVGLWRCASRLPYRRRSRRRGAVAEDCCTVMWCS
jgi:hypothetical protein